MTSTTFNNSWHARLTRALPRRAELDMRVQQLEMALASLAQRGDVVSKEVGERMQNMVEAANSSLLTQLQRAVATLDSQMKQVHLPPEALTLTPT